MNKIFQELILRLDLRFDEVYGLLSEKDQKEFDLRLRRRCFGQDSAIVTHGKIDEKLRNGFAEVYLFRKIAPENLEKAIEISKEKFVNPILTFEYGQNLEARHSRDLKASIRIWSEAPQVKSAHVDWSYNNERGLFESQGTEMDERRLLGKNLITFEQKFCIFVPNQPNPTRYVQVYRL